MRLRELIDLAKKGLGWHVKDFPITFSKFLEYIVDKYSVEDVDVRYEDRST